MLEVSQETRAAYQLDGIHKEIKIVFPDFGLTLHNNSIVSESLQLKQSIQEGDALECVGCISSSFSIQLADVVNKFVRGNRIEAYIKAGDTEEICLFKGFVDSAKKEANRKIKTIEAYDVLYKLSGQAGIPGEDDKLYDITEWYNNHGPITIEGLLREVCQKFGIQIDPNAPTLYNGHFTTECGSKRKASSLSALDLLKNICQINACFGYITNEGLFSWKYLGGSSYDSLGNLYPSEYIYPSDNIWPGRDKDHADQRAENYLGWYMDIKYEDFIVQPIQQVIIRDTSNDENPGKSGSGKNKYIIQGNILVYGQDTSIKNQMAANIYDRLNSIGYVPFNANNQGLPYMECGDEISYIDLTANPDTGTKIDFFIFNRTFKGCQYLTDNYSAEGDEYQDEFVTDGGGANDIVNEVEDKVDDLADEVENLKDTILYKIISVDAIPENPETNTLYVIRGVCRVVQEKYWKEKEDEESEAETETDNLKGDENDTKS